MSDGLKEFEVVVERQDVVRVLASDEREAERFAQTRFSPRPTVVSVRPITRKPAAATD